MMYEVSDLIQNLQFSDRNQWEQNRLVCLSIAQKMCKKQLKLTDIYKLPWDNEQSESSALTAEERQANELWQQQMCDYLNKQQQIINNGE